MTAYALPPRATNSARYETTVAWFGRGNPLPHNSLYRPLPTPLESRNDMPPKSMLSEEHERAVDDSDLIADTGGVALLVTAIRKFVPRPAASRGRRPAYGDHSGLRPYLCIRVTWIAPCALALIETQRPGRPRGGACCRNLKGRRVRPGAGGRLRRAALSPAWARSQNSRSALTGIIGARRPWIVPMISSTSIPCR